MRSTKRSHLLALAAILLPNLTSAAISLPQFQAIVGFNAICTAAYSLPVTSCTAYDFENGNPCSAECIAGLQTLTTEINAACQGSRADPKSLIGLFFEGKGVSTLCPNTGSTSTSTTDIVQISTTTSQASSTSTAVTVTVSSTTATTTSFSTISSTVQSTTSTSSTATATVVSTTSKTSSSSTTSSSTTSSSDTSTTTSSTSTHTAKAKHKTKGFTTTVFNNGVASTITSKPQRTGSSNPDAFGGGGSPFEVGPNDSGAATTRMTLVRMWSSLLIVGFVAVVFL